MKTEIEAKSFPASTPRWLRSAIGEAGAPQPALPFDRAVRATRMGKMSEDRPSAIAAR